MIYYKKEGDINMMDLEPLLNFVVKYGFIGLGIWTVFKFYKQQSFNKEMKKLEADSAEKMLNLKTDLEKDIKYYEQRLALLTEQVRCQHDRGTEDFKLWTVKRHQAYAEIHEELVKLFPLICNMSIALQCGYFELDVIHFEEDVIALTKKLKTSLILQTEIIEKWRVDREEANVMLEKLLLINDVRIIGEVSSLIRDKTYRWSLYLPQDRRNDLLNINIPVDIGIDFDMSMLSLNKLSLDERKKQLCDSIEKLIIHCRDVMNKMVKDLSGELDKDTNNV